MLSWRCLANHVMRGFPSAQIRFLFNEHGQQVSPDIVGYFTSTSCRPRGQIADGRFALEVKDKFDPRHCRILTPTSQAWPWGFLSIPDSNKIALLTWLVGLVVPAEFSKGLSSLKNNTSWHTDGNIRTFGFIKVRFTWGVKNVRSEGLK